MVFNPVYASMYGVVLSSIVAGWNVYKEILSKRGRLKFHYDEEFISDDKNQIFGNYAVISITNFSEKNRVIRKIQIDRFLTQKEIYTVVDEDMELPIRLETGEQLKYKLYCLDKENKYASYNYTELKNEAIPDDEKMLTTVLYTPVKLRIRVSDTLGKSYKSKWVKLKVLDRIPDVINT